MKNPFTVVLNAHVCAILIMVNIGWNGCSQAQDVNPSLKCEIENCLAVDARANAAHICEVSNATNVIIRYTIEVPQSTERTLIKIPINPTPIPAHGCYINLNVTQKATQTSVPIQIVNNAAGKAGNRVIGKIEFRIPKDNLAHRDRVEQWWAKYKENPKHNTSTFTQNKSLSDSEVINYFTENIIENSLGDYQFACTYISDETGKWNGQIASSPFEFKIIKANTMLDMQ